MLDKRKYLVKMGNVVNMVRFWTGTNAKPHSIHPKSLAGGSGMLCLGRLRPFACAVVFLVASASASGLALAGPIPNSWSTSGDYDEQVTQINSVDFTASGSSLSEERFAARVEEAYLHNAGGVIDSTTYGAYASYGVNETKVLDFNTGSLVLGNPGTKATPISGASSFAITDPTRSGQFGFNGVVYGADPGEKVVEAGLTALSYSGTTYPNVTISAVLDNGSLLTSQRAIHESAGAGDTFFGFTAPAGRYINSINVNFSTTNSVDRLWIDDIGFRTAPVAQQNLQKIATVDGAAASTDGVHYTITDGADSIFTQMNPPANVYKRGVIEFKMDQMPAQADVTNAMLELDVNLFSHAAGSTCKLNVIGYAGNGTLEAADATQSGSIIGQGVIKNLGILAISLDPAAVESIINSGAGLGLLLMPDTLGDQVGWYASEALYADLKPTLTLDFTPVPEPRTLGVLAMVAALALLRRRRR